MTDEPQVSTDGPYRVWRWPRGRTRSTLYLGPPIAGNATVEELTWPVVSAVRRVRSTFIDGPPVQGNFTHEELNMPVVDTGCEVITPSAEVLSSEAESAVRQFAGEVAALLERTAPAERAAVLHRLRGLLSDISADRPAA